MKHQFAATLLVFSLNSLPAQDEPAPPITAAEAVKLGVDGIAEKRGDQSEVGYANAAVTYAAAKRLETENALAARDVSLVVDLDHFRDIIANWDMAWSEAMYAAAGGGTMWARLPAHLEASGEEMLAEFAKRLPLKEGGASPETLAKWNKVGKIIEKAPVPEYADDTTKAGWKEQKEALHTLWENLGYELQAIDDASARILLEHVFPEEEQLDMLSGE
jgi:hypothetical protein